MPTPTLSIITINYNNAVGLLKTIQSVINQSFNDFEFIIIDGNSDDESTELIKKYANKIAYSISEPDDGIYFAQNKGISIAKGEYFLFLNSGDFLISNDVLQKVFMLNSKEDILACDMVFDYGNGKLLNKSQPDTLTYFYMMESSLWHPATFIKGDLFKKYDTYDTDYKIASDYDFFLKTTIVNNVSYKHISVVLSVFDTSGISSNIKNLEKHQLERLTIQRKYFAQNLINAAIQHNSLIKSNSFKLVKFLKRIPIINIVFKVVFNFIITIKRFLIK